MKLGTDSPNSSQLSAMQSITSPPKIQRITETLGLPVKYNTLDGITKIPVPMVRLRMRQATVSPSSRCPAVGPRSTRCLESQGLANYGTLGRYFAGVSGEGFQLCKFSVWKNTYIPLPSLSNSLLQLIERNGFQLLHTRANDALPDVLLCHCCCFSALFSIPSDLVWVHGGDIWGWETSLNLEARSDSRQDMDRPLSSMPGHNSVRSSSTP